MTENDFNSSEKPVNMEEPDSDIEDRVEKAVGEVVEEDNLEIDEGLLKQKVLEEIEVRDRRSFIKYATAGFAALTITPFTGAASLLSGTTIGSNTAWHSGNDGSGSGLNADIVNSEHFSTGTSKPGSPSTDELFHDTDGDAIHYFDGSSWNKVDGSV